MISDEELLQAVDEDGVGLTRWEVDFCESLTRWLEDTDAFTERQRAVLERIAGDRVPDMRERLVEEADDPAPPGVATREEREEYERDRRDDR